MPVVIAAPGDLDLSTFRLVAWEGETVELGNVAVERMAVRRRAFEEFVGAAGEGHLYGITTAHHRGAATLLSPEAWFAYARRIPRLPLLSVCRFLSGWSAGSWAARVSGFVATGRRCAPNLRRP
jgi:hypothetical protein